MLTPRNHTERRDEERRAEERRAEERRAEERRAEERRAEERRAEERRAEERKAGAFIGGGPVDPGSAVARIASARCEREVRCNHVGVKQKYPTRAECVILMQDDKRDEINEKDCPGGLDKKQLNACLVAIRDESCGNALDAINRLVACRASSICLKYEKEELAMVKLVSPKQDKSSQKRGRRWAKCMLHRLKERWLAVPLVLAGHPRTGRTIVLAFTAESLPQRDRDHLVEVVQNGARLAWRYLARTSEVVRSKT